VEDEEMVRNITAAILENHGYLVITAATLQEGLDHWQNNDIDLLVSDVMLPDGTGTELARAIQQDDPNLPILMCSGYSDDKSHQDLIRDHNLSFLAKPFSRHQLLRAIASLEKKSRKQAEADPPNPGNKVAVWLSCRLPATLQNG